VELLSARASPDLHLIGAAADAVREHYSGSRVGYVVNRNINFTNSCVKRCGFCAFSRTGIDAEAYFLPQEEIVRRSREAADLGATEVCLQAGLPPAMLPGLYEATARAVKAAVPSLHLHAFSPEEVLYGARVSRRTVREMLQALKEAGVDSLPGTSAEILCDDVRAQIAGQRLSTAQWIDVIKTAHELGLRTTSTMMFGHIEEPHHIARHLQLIREIQDATGGFTEFVPLSFVAREAPMHREGRIAGMRAGPTGREVLLAHAVARLMLAGSVNNIQVSWVKEGLRMAQLLLTQGANDLGGTLMNESISTAAGASHGQLATPSELRALALDVGREPYQRSTTYGEVASSVDRLKAMDPSSLGSFHALIGSPRWRAKEALGRAKRALHTEATRTGAGLGGARLAASTEGRRTVTYSRSFTLVPTYECFNRCTYCNFRTDLGRSRWLGLEEAAERLEALKGQVDEILILSGEVHPRAKNRAAWHRHIMELCSLALDRGFLPHCNVGPLSLEEMAALASLNPSMGLMLEQAVPLAVHRFAPSKEPATRLRQLRQAGALGLPFTTGLLLGIGESAADRTAGLRAIAEVASEFGHIQEVILQPFSAGEQDAWQKSAPQLAGERHFEAAMMPALVAEARRLLPEDVTIQVPPNLFTGEGALDLLLECLRAGAGDLGGMSPKDEVNPLYGFPDLERLREALRSQGFDLAPRLCIHQSKLHHLERPERRRLYERVIEMGDVSV